MTEDANRRHITALRTKSWEERERIAALTGKLGDLKQLLEPATSQLDFVDHFFLDGKILSEDRTPQKLARWLNGADAALKIAIRQREFVEAQAARFGNDAKLFHT